MEKVEPLETPSQEEQLKKFISDLSYNFGLMRGLLVSVENTLTANQLNILKKVDEATERMYYQANLEVKDA